MAIQDKDKQKEALEKTLQKFSELLPSVNPEVHPAERALVIIDGTAKSKAAVLCAGELNRHFGTKIDVICFYTEQPPTAAETSRESYEDSLAFAYEHLKSEDFEINLNLDATSKNGFWKYEEDLTLKEIRDYLSGTYRSHYTSQESQTQTLDLIESIGDAEPFCRSNAIKYLSRFGKKNGKSKQDILKAIHYCILLYHFAGLHNETKDTYETF